MTIEAGFIKYSQLNEQIRDQLKSVNEVEITDVNGQRYLGCAIDKGKTLKIVGTPGNDMACYLNGGKIEVFGNCQDATGNTMNGGEIIIHGHSGDALGYAMRDGEIYVKTNVSCRGGIHMKEFGNMKPVLVIGKNAGSFLGEYMAGGTIVLLGLDMNEGEKLFGSHCASGMHGGKIIIRGDFPKENLSSNIIVEQLSQEDNEELKNYVKKYCNNFGKNYSDVINGAFCKLVPATSRPYANLYTPN